jgi:hypothetical protein
VVPPSESGTDPHGNSGDQWGRGDGQGYGDWGDQSQDGRAVVQGGVPLPGA